MNEHDYYANQEKKLMIAVLSGWQNEMGHHDMENPEYKAYQRMIEYLNKEMKG